MTLPAVNVSRSRVSPTTNASNLRFKTFTFKTSNSNRLEIRKIRIEQEEGPSLHNGIFYLDVLFTGDLHVNNVYEESLLPFMGNHIVPEVHNHLIYSMHRWPNTTSQFIRKNGRLFPINEIPYDVGDYIEFNRNVYRIDWMPTRDGRIYLHNAYKNKIDIFGGRKVDVVRSEATDSVCYEGNGTKRMYWTANDIETTFLVYRGRHTGAFRTYKLICQFKDLYHLRDCYYIAFKSAAQCFKFSRVGDKYENTFALSGVALSHMKNYYNLVPSKRSRTTPFIFHIFQRKLSQFSKGSQSVQVSTCQYMLTSAILSVSNSKFKIKK